MPYAEAIVIAVDHAGPEGPVYTLRVAVRGKQREVSYAPQGSEEAERLDGALDAYRIEAPGAVLRVVFEDGTVVRLAEV